jgi:hypothetical protein
MNRQEPALSGAEKRTAKNAKSAKVGAESKGRQERQGEEPERMETRL